MAIATENRTGKILAALVFVFLFLAAHVVVPPIAAFYSPRDSDMGLWFCRLTKRGNWGTLLR